MNEDASRNVSSRGPRNKHGAFWGPISMAATLQRLLLLLGCIGLCAAESHDQHHNHDRDHDRQDQPQKPPHIVFMIVDDLGWNDVSFHGSKQIPTPNVDAIARDGIILNQYYVQPMCSPSRGSLMTGKYPIRIGFQHFVILANVPWGLPLNETILPEYLKTLDYATYHVGKWHLGFFQEDYLPLNRGFDSYFGFYTGVEDYYDHISKQGDMAGLDLHDNYQHRWDYNGTYGTDLFTAKAREVILNHNPEKPMFLYLAQQAPHTGNFDNPLQAPERYVRPMIGIKDRNRRTYAGMVSAMDRSVGDVFAALEEAGMLDNTIFIFTTDNGGVPQESFDGSSGSNWPLKGSKYTLWEGGVRGVGFVWSPLLRQRSRVYNELMHISDWLPTIVSAAGGPDALQMLPKDMDAVDQWPSLTGDSQSPRQEVLLNLDDTGKVSGIRRGRYKLVDGTPSNGTYDQWYDKDGRVFNYSYSLHTPLQKLLYRINYSRFLRRSQAARVLWNKYGREPRLAAYCTTRACRRQLETRCRGPPPSVPTCDAQNEACLYDIVRDPCEYYNIAKEQPELTAELLLAIDKYRAVAIPPGGGPGDPEADPKLRGNVWDPWR